MAERGSGWHLRFSQQARWTEELRRYFLDRISGASRRAILEVGCGTGAVLGEFASRGPSGALDRLFGLDIDSKFLHQAAGFTSPASLLQADAHDLPFISGSFDLVYTHFLLLWVENPLRVLQECRRVARLGGWVAAFAEPDYGGRLDYPDELADLGKAQEESLRRQGAETHLGRRLKALFLQAGLNKIECGVLGAQWIRPESRSEYELEWQVALADVRDDLSQDEISRYEKLAYESWENGERILFVPTFYAFGRA